MNQDYLTSTQVAVLIGVSEATLNFWYRFKRTYPDNEYAQLLPEFVRTGTLQQRFWKREDLWKLIEFKNAIPKGRNGIMGSITQRYVRKEKNNGQKKNRTKCGAGN